MYCTPIPPQNPPKTPPKTVPYSHTPMTGASSSMSCPSAHRLFDAATMCVHPLWHSDECAGIFWGSQRVEFQLEKKTQGLSFFGGAEIVAKTKQNAAAGAENGAKSTADVAIVRAGGAIGGSVRAYRVTAGCWGSSARGRGFVHCAGSPPQLFLKKIQKSDPSCLWWVFSDTTMKDEFIQTEEWVLLEASKYTDVVATHRDKRSRWRWPSSRTDDSNPMYANRGRRDDRANDASAKSGFSGV